MRRRRRRREKERTAISTEMDTALKATQSEGEENGKKGKH